MNPITKKKKKKEKYPDRRSVTDLVNELAELETYRKKFVVSEEAVIEALKIEPEDRKLEQIGVITKFLEGSELANKFKSENVNPNTEFFKRHFNIMCLSYEISFYAKR